MTTRVYDEFRGTPLWAAVSSMLQELQATQEIALRTAPDYVVGYLCQELAAKRLLDPEALTRGPSVHDDAGR